MKPTWHVFVWRAKLRSAILAKQEKSQTLTDTRSDSRRQGVIYRSSCDIFWALDKQVHHRDLHGKSLMPGAHSAISRNPHKAPLDCAGEQRRMNLREKSDMALCYGSVPEQL